jgi:hypothetical protein
MRNYGAKNDTKQARSTVQGRMHENKELAPEALEILEQAIVVPEESDPCRSLVYKSQGKEKLSTCRFGQCR